MSFHEEQTIADRILFWGKTDPETPAFIFWSEDGTRDLTRGDVLDLSSRFANRLVRCGIKPGDVVCISLPNCPERIVAEFGVQLAGAVSMNGQVLRADGEDLIVSLIKAECSCIVVDPSQTKGAWSLCQPHLDDCDIFECHANVKCERIPSLKSVLFSSTQLSQDLRQEDMLVYERMDPASAAVIFTTSGSSGYSKLVQHSHKTILYLSDLLGEIMILEKGSSYLNCSPLGWLGGYPFLYLTAGCVRYLLDEYAKQTKEKGVLMWDIVYEVNIGAALMTPIILLSAPTDRNTLRKYLHILTGGQPIKSLHLKAVKHIAKNVTVCYGSSEVGFITSITLSSDCIDTFEDFQAGYPAKGVTQKIVDINGQVPQFMTKGEILIKSPTLCLAYLGSDSQESFLPDGWFRTGDIGYLREDGCLFLEGRSSEAIMHGAYILYPTWWEQKLVKCPGVKEAVIVPVPDKVLHHEICACIKLDDTADVKPTTDDIIGFCKQETLLDETSNLNILPKYVLFFDEFPKTNTDKLHRRRLADKASQCLGLSE